MKFKKIIVCSMIIIFILFILFLILKPILNFDSNPESRFSGISDYFQFEGKNSTVQFNAKNIIFDTNKTKEIEFLSVKNIKVDDDTKDKRMSFRIQFIDGYQSISNAFIEIQFKKLYMVRGIRDGKWINLQGDLNNNYLSKLDGEVNIVNSSVNYIIILNGTTTRNSTIEDFENLYFEMDNQSSIKFISESIDLKAYQTSDLQIPFSEISQLLLLESEGNFRLNNHRFDINGADKLEIKNITGPKTEQTYFNVENKKIVFAGYTNDTLLNSKSIILGDFLYWLDYKPEIINGYTALIAIFVALLSFIISLRERP